MFYTQFIFMYLKESRIQDEATFNLKNCHSRNDLFASYHDLMLLI